MTAVGLVARGDENAAHALVPAAGLQQVPRATDVDLERAEHVVLHLADDRLRRQVEHALDPPLADGAHEPVQVAHVADEVAHRRPRAVREAAAHVVLLELVPAEDDDPARLDLGGEAAIQSATTFVEPTMTYPRGSVDVTIPFAEPGRFIGLVTANDPETKQHYVSVFPFSVGVAAWYDGWVWLVGTVLLGIVLFLRPWQQRQTRDDQSTPS